MTTHLATSKQLNTWLIATAVPGMCIATIACNSEKKAPAPSPDVPSQVHNDDPNIVLKNFESHVRQELSGAEFEGVLQGQYRGRFGCRWTTFDLQKLSERSSARGIAIGELVYLGGAPVPLRAAFRQEGSTWECERPTNRYQPGEFETSVGFASQPSDACRIVLFACSAGKHGNAPR